MGKTYPENSFDNLTQLVGMLGSFWTEVYDGKDTSAAFIQSRAELEKQNFQDLLNLPKAINLHDCPTFRSVRWFPIKMDLSTYKLADAVGYGDGYIYGNQEDSGDTLSYGNPKDRSVSYEISSDIKDVDVLCSNPVIFDVCMVAGVDFWFDAINHRLHFLSDPFLNPKVEWEDSQEGQIKILWGSNVKLDKAYLYNHVGYILGIYEDTSTNSYKKLLSSVAAAIAGGTSDANIRDFVSAITGIACVKSDNEIVETITADHNYKLVITDKNVYRFNLTSNVIVAVGQILRKGDWLIDGIQFFDTNLGEVPDDSLIGQLNLDQDFLIGDIGGPLTFVNKEVPITTSVVSDYLRVSWELGGQATHVDQFFTSLHERGIAEDQTLAHLLDVRTSPTDEPNASNLPATINPMQFLVQNVLRSSCLLIYLRTKDFTDDRLETRHLAYLRNILPPHICVIIFTDVEQSAESLILETTGSEDNTGVTEEYEIFVV